MSAVVGDSLPVFFTLIKIMSSNLVSFISMKSSTEYYGTDIYKFNPYLIYLYNELYCDICEFSCTLEYGIEIAIAGSEYI